MPRSARIRKLLGDVAAEGGRLLLMVLAVAVSLTAILAVLGARTILGREITRSYAETNPAVATLEIPAGISPELLTVLRAAPNVGSAERREVITARVFSGAESRPALLFVADDFTTLGVSRFFPERGAVTPPPGTVLIERSAVRMTEEGAPLVLQTPHGVAQEVKVSGQVFDPGLAPAWQERELYLYATQETARALGETQVFTEARVSFAREPADLGDAEQMTGALATWLRERNVMVAEVRVPPPRMHPHQRQMNTILMLLTVFAALSLVLAAVLVQSSLASMLARQVREIGVMKALGARSGQLFRLYAALVLGLSGVAVVLSIPVGLLGARVFAARVATMLNFNLVNVSVPTWVYLLVLIAGLVLPLAFASIPIRRATRIPVRQALDDHGALSSPGLIRRFAMWPRPVRSLLRRPGRLLLTLVLLAFGGGLFVSAYSLSRAWTRNAEKMRAQRHYDVEVRVNQGLSAEDLAWVRSRPDLSVVEVWGYEPVALLHRDGVDVLRTYPDGGHGSSTLMLPPADTRLVSLPMLEGRWLHAGETGGVVLNHVAAAQAGGKQVGDTLVLYVDHEPRPAHIVGIAEEVGSAAVVYADPAFLLDDPSFQPRMLRLKTRAVDEQARAAVIASLDAALRARGVHVATVVPLAELRTAVGDHVLILVRALTLLAFIFAVVGLSGLLQAMGTAVLERTRELGVMKSLGASKARLRRMLVDEALWLVLASFVLSLLLAVPLTWSVCVVVGKAGFLAPLPFTLSLGAVAAWLLMLVGMSIAVTWPLSSRAANISVREALAAT